MLVNWGLLEKGVPNQLKSAGYLGMVMLCAVDEGVREICNYLHLPALHLVSVTVTISLRWNSITQMVSRRVTCRRGKKCVHGTWSVNLMKSKPSVTECRLSFSNVGVHRNHWRPQTVKSGVGRGNPHF